MTTAAVLLPTEVLCPEAERLAALHQYGMVGTAPEQRFDDITRLAADICGVPSALISLVDQHELWFKSRINFCYSHAPRAGTWCEKTFQNNALLVIEDTLNSPLTDPLQPNNPDIRFYAGVPLINHEGHAIGVLCVFDSQPRQINHSQQQALHVLSRQVMTQMELSRSLLNVQHQAEQLERINSNKNRFFSIIAHDLRAAFHGILGFSDVLDTEFDELDQATVRKIASYLNHASQSTFKLLENLLEWAMLENGAMRFRPETLRLESVVDTVMTGLHLSALQKNIQLDFNIDPQVLLQADLNMLRSLLHNLVSNAIKFSPQGRRVWIEQQIEGNQVLLHIRDNGVGMSAQQLERLFHIDLSRSSKGTVGEGGTGLGLLLCKQFVEQHQGDLSVHSVLGEGSTFTVRLPLG